MQESGQAEDNWNKQMKQISESKAYCLLSFVISINSLTYGCTHDKEVETSTVGEQEGKLGWRRGTARHWRLCSCFNIYFYENGCIQNTMCI